MSRHTPYARVEPPGAWVARYYCPEGHTTFSLLPDCLASRLSSSLAAVEVVARAVEEKAGESFESVAERLRPDIGRQGAVRWVRRRVVAAVVALVTLKGLKPEVLAGVQPHLKEVRAVLGVEHVLPALREMAGAQVACVPCPVGLGPRQRGGDVGGRRLQQQAGADPPCRHAPASAIRPNGRA